MKKLVTALFVMLVALGSRANAQNIDTLLNTAPISNPKNIVKVNLFSLALNNYSFQFERAIGRKISFSVGVRYMPYANLPLKDSFKEIIGDEELLNDMSEFKTGNTAITPEVRFYVGKGVFRGFYFAPFARFSKFKAELPVQYEFEYQDDFGQTHTHTENIFLNGSINTVTGGLLLGAQWKLSRALYLDWWMLGAQYGSSKGSIQGKFEVQLSDEQANGLEEGEFKYGTVKVDADRKGARMDLKGPWGGLRAGLNLGIRF